MSEEGPKLYTNKPKKAQVKAAATTASATPTSTSSSAAAVAAAATYKMGSQSTPPPPPQPPRESFARRYKFLWPILLGVNFMVGAYLFMRTNKKDTGPAEEVANTATAPATSSATPTIAAVPEAHVSSPAIPEPVKIREPIEDRQQRELFKWILEEKRKLKPKDSEEKKRIEEEKAILKQFIRAKSIPNIS